MCDVCVCVCLTYYYVALYDIGKARQERVRKGTEGTTSNVENDLTSVFFREEYALNHLISTLITPHIAILDGATSMHSITVYIVWREREKATHTHTWQEDHCIL